MLKTILIIENLQEPIDEGTKRFNFNLAKYFENTKDCIIFSRHQNSNISNIKLLPKNKLNFSVNFFKTLHKHSGKNTLIYVPETSTTFFTFLRLFLMGLCFKKKHITLIAIQKINHSVWQQKIIRKIKPGKIIVFSKKDYDYYKNLGFSTVLSSTGVNLDKFKQTNSSLKMKLRDKYGFKSDEKIILHVGHIKKTRNLEVLKYMIPFGYTILIIASTTTIADSDFQEYLEEIGFYIIREFIPNIQEFYQLADIYIFPVSSFDNAIEFPLSILEAISCNIPVLSTRFGGLVDFFHENQYFQFFENEHDLIQKVNKLSLTPPEHYRNKIIKQFSWDNIFQQIDVQRTD